MSLSANTGDKKLANDHDEVLTREELHDFHQEVQ